MRTRQIAMWVLGDFTLGCHYAWHYLLKPVPPFEMVRLQVACLYDVVCNSGEQLSLSGMVITFVRFRMQCAELSLLSR